MGLSVSQIALKDINEYNKKRKAERRLNLLEHETDSMWESWFVGSSHLQTKTTARLNRMLGIHKINKSWN